MSEQCEFHKGKDRYAECDACASLEARAPLLKRIAALESAVARLREVVDVARTHADWCDADGEYDGIAQLDAALKALAQEDQT